jgi:hypothetical protein
MQGYFAFRIRAGPCCTLVTRIVPSAGAKKASRWLKDYPIRIVWLLPGLSQDLSFKAEERWRRLERRPKV